VNSKDSELIDHFVRGFAELDDLRVASGIDPIAWELAEGEADEFGRRAWRPLEHETDPACLQPLYAVLPARFPPLYESMVLRYRWADVDLQSFTLMANPIGGDLMPLLRRISADQYLWSQLIRAGYIPFGKGTGGDYDPVCFELKSRRQNAEFRIVKIDHERILSFDRLEVVAGIAPSFRHLVLRTIELADKSAEKNS
jgi:hypothetical protein